ncbi:MAG: hypothetical protein AAFR25_11805 [Cyanobacteria bacterium J06629_19]
MLRISALRQFLECLPIALVAQNSSDITKLTVKQDRNAEQLEALTAAQDRNASQIEALAETSRNQLAAIIGNSRRLDRLEQQAG